MKQLPEFSKMLRINTALYLLLGISGVSSAAPALQIHVFEPEATTPTLLTNPINYKPLAPARRHRLKTHVFEPEAATPTLQTNPLNYKPLAPARRHRLKTHVFDNATPASANQNSARNAMHIDKEPILAYQSADFYVNTGYRRDNLDWSIATRDGTPNILSELAWKDIEVATINVGTTLYFKSNWLLNVDLMYGHIFDGKNQDSDYRESNRQSEFLRSYANSDKGTTLDASIHAGYEWLALSNEQQALTLTPKIGFSYHSQFFNDTDGNLVVSAVAPEYGITEALPLGSFSGLDSNYDATWMGPWLGIEGQFIINDNLKIGLNLEYHYAIYDATANWNLRSDFAHPESFTHEAKGYGLVSSIAGQLRLNNALSLKASVDYQDWQAHKDGSGTTYLSDGSSRTANFNGVNWSSFGANVGLTYEF